MTSARHAHVVGLGLIGASLAMSLREAGWRVTGSDVDSDVVAAALSTGVIEGNAAASSVELIAIATPAGAVTGVALDYLARFPDRELIVTDVAGVKGAIVQRRHRSSIPRWTPDGGIRAEGAQGCARPISSKVARGY